MFWSFRTRRRSSRSGPAGPGPADRAGRARSGQRAGSSVPGAVSRHLDAPVGHRGEHLEDTVAPNVANQRLRTPAVPARTVATLDLLSQGRVEFAAADPERAGLRGGPSGL